MRWLRRAEPRVSSEFAFSGGCFNRLAIWRYGGLGDSLLAVPMLAGLRERGWESIDFYGHPGALELLLATGMVDRAGDISNGGDRPPVFEYAAVDDHTCQVMKSQLDDPDLTIIFARDVGLAAEACRRIGLRNWKVAAATPDPYTHQAVHMCREVGVACDRDMTIKISAEAGPDVLLAPGSHYERKRWPFERYSTLVNLLAARGYSVAYLTDGEPWPDRLNPSLRGDVMHIAPLIAGCTLFVGNDTGITHLAGLLGVPTIGIYGPTHPATWGPLGPRAHYVRTCRRKAHQITDDIFVCRKRHCLSSLREDEVLKAIDDVLA